LNKSPLKIILPVVLAVSLSAMMRTTPGFPLYLLRRMPLPSLTEIIFGCGKTGTLTLRLYRARFSADRKTHRDLH